jgi:hypothetical protein
MPLPKQLTWCSYPCSDVYAIESMPEAIALVKMDALPEQS